MKKIKEHWREIRDRHERDRQKHPRPRCILIGAPDDRGVLNVGGRLGAAEGPAAVRKFLPSMMLGSNGEIEQIGLCPGYDAARGDSIEAGHSNLARAVEETLRDGQIPIVVGGGHDYGYPHVLGANRAVGGSAKLALVNVDAHLDVRPLRDGQITSGSPFYLALEQNALSPKRFIEFGVQEHCNDRHHFAYARDRKIGILTLDDARAGAGPVERLKKILAGYARRGVRVVASFDVDAMQMAHAPGVSAPQSDGFTPAEFLGMARVCGESTAVATIGFFEYSPLLDENQKTVRLVATAIHRFACGVARRPVQVKGLVKKKRR